ncbi:MAG: helix-turn-helix domain-containing protein [Oscillospiraceae bacterium]
MKNIDIQTLYKLLFADYPDIVTVRQLQVMLGTSRHAAYDLLTDGSIRGLKPGNAYKIPKINVIRYVVENGVQPAARGRQLLTLLCRRAPLTAVRPVFCPVRGLTGDAGVCQRRFAGLFRAAVAAFCPIHQTN